MQCRIRKFFRWRAPADPNLTGRGEEDTINLVVSSQLGVGEVWRKEEKDIEERKRRGVKRRKVGRESEGERQYGPPSGEKPAVPLSDANCAAI
jgi:hypothetical protein